MFPAAKVELANALVTENAQSSRIHYTTGAKVIVILESLSCSEAQVLPNTTYLSAFNLTAYRKKSVSVSVMVKTFPQSYVTRPVRQPRGMSRNDSFQPSHLTLAGLESYNGRHVNSNPMISHWLRACIGTRRILDNHLFRWSETRYIDWMGGDGHYRLNLFYIQSFIVKS